MQSGFLMLHLTFKMVAMTIFLQHEIAHDYCNYTLDFSTDFCEYSGCAYSE